MHRHRHVVRFIFALIVVAVVVGLIATFSMTTLEGWLTLNKSLGVTVFGRAYGATFPMELALLIVEAIVLGYLAVFIVEGTFGSRRRHGIVAMIARFASLGLILFMLVTLDLRNIVGSRSMVSIEHYLWYGTWIYIVLQMLDTATRPSTDIWGFFADFALDIIAMIGGILFFGLVFGNTWFRSYPWEEKSIMVQCTLWAGAALFLGVLLFIRISGSWKDRAELETRAR